jgi:hypothetical protein
VLDAQAKYRAPRKRCGREFLIPTRGRIIEQRGEVERIQIPEVQSILFRKQNKNKAFMTKSLMYFPLI